MVTLTKQEIQTVTLTKQGAMLKLKATIKTQATGLYTSRGISHPTRQPRNAQAVGAYSHELLH